MSNFLGRLMYRSSNTTPGAASLYVSSKGFIEEVRNSIREYLCNSCEHPTRHYRMFKDGTLLCPTCLFLRGL